MSLEFLAQSAQLATALAALIGLLVGSFLNVVIHRLPIMMERDWANQAAELRDEPPPHTDRFGLHTPRSRCPSCAQPIGVLQNVPILSWLIQRGRCRHCDKPISARYPLVELASAALSALAIHVLGPGAAGLGAVLFCWALIALAMIDLDTQLLPDSITLPLLWLGLLFNLGGTYTPIPDAVIGAMVGYLSLWTVYWVFRLLTGKEGMGFGDFKLLAAIGAWFGWSALPAVILLASLVGAVVGIAMMVFARHGREVPIPFGPYLAGAGLLALYFRGPLAALYGLG